MFIQEFDLPGPGGAPGLHVGIWAEQHNATPVPAYNQTEARAVEKTDHVVYKIHVQNMNKELWCRDLRARVDWNGANATHPGFPPTEVIDYVDPAMHAAITPPELHTIPGPPYNGVPLEGSDLRYLLFYRLAPFKQNGDQTTSSLTVDVHGMNPPANFAIGMHFDYEWYKPVKPVASNRGDTKFEQKIHD